MAEVKRRDERNRVAMVGMFLQMNRYRPPLEELTELLRPLLDDILALKPINEVDVLRLKYALEIAESVIKRDKISNIHFDWSGQ